MIVIYSGRQTSRTTRLIEMSASDEAEGKVNYIIVSSHAERQLSAYLRYTFLNPADPREVDFPGSWFKSEPPGNWKPSEFGHYPLHWYSHALF